MKAKLIAATLAFAATLAVGMYPKTMTYEAPKYETKESKVVEKKATTTVEKVAKFNGPFPELTGELREIARCESTLRQYHKDGSVVRGVVNPRDVGVLQINLDYHEKTARKMGLDLFTAEGNIAYGKWLYKTQGSRPWNWSKRCWGK